MKKLLFILFFLSSIVYSQNYNLTINLKNGNTVTFSTDDIQKIEFKNLTGIEDVETLQQLIQSNHLKQNYPNPFNPSTTIEYEIPNSSDVNVSIFDIRGQIVKELLNERQTEGVHKVTWNGTNQNQEQVASGVYIYTIQYGDQRQSNRMIFMK